MLERHECQKRLSRLHVLLEHFWTLRTLCKLQRYIVNQA